jgi:hypothetical protein
MCYDLNLNLGHQPNKKITSGCHDGKHDLQAPTSYKIRSLANHFAKMTKYMIEESEHYMDHLNVTSHLRPHWIQNPRGRIGLQPYRI